MKMNQNFVITAVVVTIAMSLASQAKAEKTMSNACTGILTSEPDGDLVIQRYNDEVICIVKNARDKRLILAKCKLGHGCMVWPDVVITCPNENVGECAEISKVSSVFSDCPGDEKLRWFFHGSMVTCLGKVTADPEIEGYYNIGKGGDCYIRAGGNTVAQLLKVCSVNHDCLVYACEGHHGGLIKLYTIKELK